MTAHRRPPPFPYQGPPQGYGWCVFCGDRILPASVKPGRKLGPHERRNPQRCTWHLECVEIYNIATSSTVARRAVFKRDQGVCAICGADTLSLVATRTYPVHLQLIGEAAPA